MATTRMSAAERRVALIQAALTVVAERGVAGATTRAIVAEAGMALASFHYAFNGRDELMIELINTVVAQEERSLAPAIAMVHDAGSIRDAIALGLSQYFDGVRQDPQHERAMFELTQYAMRTEGMQQLAIGQYQRYYALAADSLEAASAAFGMQWACPLETVAALLVALTDGLTIAWLVNGDDQAADELITRAADAIAALAAPLTDERPLPEPEQTRRQ